MPKHELQSVTNDDVLWSVERCALHLGVTTATIRRYIRDGLPTKYGLVDRAALLREYQQRVLRQRAILGTRPKDSFQ